MDKEKALDIIRESNGSLISFILTTIEAILGEESKAKQVQSIRKLFLDRHAQNLRDLEVRIRGEK